MITPHPGEMARLAGYSIADVQKNRLKTARNFAREHNLIVVLKGHRTLVAQPERRDLGEHDRQSWNVDWRNGRYSDRDGRGNDGAESQGNMSAVCAAVHLHGLAGDVMRDRVGEHSLVATDLLPGLPDAFERAQAAIRQQFVQIG